MTTRENLVIYGSMIGSVWYKVAELWVQTNGFTGTLPSQEAFILQLLFAIGVGGSIGIFISYLTDLRISHNIGGRPQRYRLQVAPPALTGLSVALYYLVKELYNVVFAGMRFDGGALTSYLHVTPEALLIAFPLGMTAYMLLLYLD